MRNLLFPLLLAAVPLLCQASDEKDAAATVQKLFDGMAGHDAAMIRATVLADARLYSVRDQSAPASMPIEDFLTRIASIQGDLLEHFTSAPQVLIHGRTAQVWGEYEFRHSGQFSHCGVDSVSLLKTAEGWKIASIVYTAETTGCKGSR
ncbi:MAG TPA: nuclear transport factor 2 family protein [Bryobacteraceae bacterium]|nr:nuclear transport factor 2 family protein [Bryobacteraceae bacterium]